MSQETTLTQNQFEFQAKYLHGEKETITVQLATPTNTPTLRGKKGLELVQDLLVLATQKDAKDFEAYTFFVERILKSFNTKHNDDESDHSWYNIVNFKVVVNKYFEVYMPYIQDFLMLDQEEMTPTVPDSKTQNQKPKKLEF
jgi:hypothetical protein